jgi:hypothetical protein
MKTPTRERRDWALLIFIIPIGIFFMLIAGQLAIRLMPFWSLTADMRSKLDPNLAPKRQVGVVQPITRGILTPYDINLTPDPGDGNVAFPPFVVFEPNGTPSATSTPQPTATPTATATTTPTRAATATPTSTKRPTSVYTPSTATRTPTKIPKTATNTITSTPTATKTITPTPTKTATKTITPTPTLTKTATRTITATQTSTFTATPTQTDTPTIAPTFSPTPTQTDTPTFTPTSTATPTFTPTIPPGASTLDPVLIPQTPPPPVGLPDGTTTDITAGSYAILDLGADLIVSGGTEPNPDLVYYEFDVTGNILLDTVIVGISEFPDARYYFEVLNWGNNISDINTNVDTSNALFPADPTCLAPFAPECDNRTIPTSYLYPQPIGGTGITIDVDGAPNILPGTYRYLVIICPTTGGDAAQIDSVEVLP